MDLELLLILENPLYIVHFTTVLSIKFELKFLSSFEHFMAFLVLEVMRLAVRDVLADVALPEGGVIIAL